VTANFDPFHRPAPGIAGAPSASSGADSDDVFGAALGPARQPAPLPDALIAPSPPPQLAAHIAAAARAWDAFAAAGQQIAFSETADGRIAIELCDEDGERLEILSGAGLFNVIEDERDA
jgi:hypothetical protein